MKNSLAFIDLSQTIENDDIKEFLPAKIKYIGYKKGSFLLGLSGYLSNKSIFHTIFSIIKAFFSGKIITARDFPDGLGLSWEKINLSTHTGTHLDAPSHFGREVSGMPAKTIEQIPLDYCFSDGVLLDLSDIAPRGLIAKLDIQNALNKIKYSLKEKDIVLIKTCAHHFIKEYKYNHPGVSPEAILWLVEKGVKIIGSDGWGIDRPAQEMVKDYLQTKDKSKLWPAHLLGRQKEYWHIEKLENLDKLPNPCGFKVACFPIKIKDASAGWARVVAIIEK